jgi:hypothetical protein
MKDTQNNTSTPLRARRRRQGQRPNEEEKCQLQERFLEVFARGGNILLACRQVGVDRSTIYRWSEQDETFALRKNQAERDFFDLAYGEFTRRAIQGYEKPVVSMGKMVYKADGSLLMERIVSDRLLEMIIKRGFPEYREKQQVEMTANVTTTSSQAEDLRLLTNEQLRMYKSWLLEARARQEEGR